MLKAWITMSNFKKRRLLILFITISMWSKLIFPSYFSLVSSVSSEYTFFVFGFLSDSSSVETRRILSELPCRKTIIFFELTQRRHGERYIEIYNSLESKCKIQILPPDVERRLWPPLIHHHNIMEYYQDYLSPLIGVFYEDKLVVIIVGPKWFNQSFWGRLVADASTWHHLHIFAPSGEYIIENDAPREELQELFITARISFSNALLLISESALRDSLYSPTFITIITTLFTLLCIMGFRNPLLMTISFTLAVYISSFLIGLGFIIPIGIAYASQVIALPALLASFIQFIKGFHIKLRSPFFTKSTMRYLMGDSQIKNRLRLLVLFIIGFVSIITLFSPQSRPYLLGLTILTELKESTQAALLLALYCFIYVMPLLLISIILHFSQGEEDRKVENKVTKLNIVEVVKGIFMVFLAFYVIIS